MPVEPFYDPEKRSCRFLGGDRRSMDRPRRDQRTAKVRSDVTVGTRSGDRKAEDFGAGTSQSFRGLILPLAFHLSQHDQQLVC
nr:MULTISPECIES: hypothetical protein [Sphingopyxis]